MRAISSPARLVQNTLSPINCCGVPTDRASSSTRKSRSTSMVLWLVMWARGLSATQPYLPMTVVRTP